jgi:hypothetical protein
VAGLQLRLLLGHLRQRLAEGGIGSRPRQAVLTGGPELAPLGQHSGTPGGPDLLAGQGERRRHRFLLGLTFGAGMSGATGAARGCLPASR